jgi:hypothetical protein
MAFYHRRIWRDRIRAQALHNAEWKCIRCGISLVGLGRAAHVHHVKPLRRAPSLGLELLNLKPLCQPCHAAEEAGTLVMVADDGSPTDPRHPWNARREWAVENQDHDPRGSSAAQTSCRDDRKAS